MYKRQGIPLSWLPSSSVTSEMSPSVIKQRIASQSSAIVSALVRNLNNASAWTLEGPLLYMTMKSYSASLKRQCIRRPGGICMLSSQRSAA